MPEAPKTTAPTTLVDFLSLVNGSTFNSPSTLAFPFVTQTALELSTRPLQEADEGTLTFDAVVFDLTVSLAPFSTFNEPAVKFCNRLLIELVAVKTTLAPLLTVT